MALIVGIFQPANDRRRGANQSRRLPSAKTGLGAQLNDFARDLIACPRFLKARNPFRLPSIVPAKREKIRG
jgi:hypothetical protein